MRGTFGDDAGTLVNDSDVNNPSNNLDVEASISESEARAGKLFGRLRVVR